MKDRKFVYGYDFGTLSCRLMMVDVDTGEVVAQAAVDYPDGEISGSLPGSTVSLPNEWYLQNPDDYIFVLGSLSRKLLAQTGIAPEQVIAIGSDFTNCTMMPVDKEGRVLCQMEEWRDYPHAWVKLWKHHGAQPYAEEMEAYALEHAPWLCDYGNNVSSEWFFPKVLQIYREAPEIYEAADMFIEAADWIVHQMTGRWIRNSATLGVNCFYDPERGYPDKDFFRGIEPGMENVVEEKMGGGIAVVGTCAGHLTEECARHMGLTVNTVVSVGHGDSEVAACGAGVVDSGSMIMVMGTSTCHQMMHRVKRCFDGLCAIVADGMIPGMYAYESGQPAVGDVFEWYARSLATPEYIEEAKRQGKSLLAFMDEKAAGLKPGESGLIALEWLNGNRSVLMDYDLTGMMMGLTLHTKPEEIFRALMEATAFGTRMIIDSYEDHGVAIEKLYGSGGLSKKSPVMMQIYADVLERRIIVPQVSNISAMGAAVCGAVAASSKRGGYDNFHDAVEKMIPKEHIEYIPNPENSEIYRRLFEVYKEMHDFLGHAGSPMKNLKNIHRCVFKGSNCQIDKKILRGKIHV